MQFCFGHKISIDGDFIKIKDTFLRKIAENIWRIERNEKLKKVVAHEKNYGALWNIIKHYVKRQKRT